MAARLERTPVAAETWLKPVMAADGLGELLRGFLPRKRIGRLRSPQPLTVHVRPTDVDMARILRVSEEPTITEVGAVGSPNVVLSGTAVAPYLALWNRGAEVDDPDGFLDRWRRDVAIAWA